VSTPASPVRRRFITCSARAKSAIRQVFSVFYVSSSIYIIITTPQVYGSSTAIQSAFRHSSYSQLLVGPEHFDSGHRFRFQIDLGANSAAHSSVVIIVFSHTICITLCVDTLFYHISMKYLLSAVKASPPSRLGCILILGAMLNFAPTKPAYFLPRRFFGINVALQSC
jgi:hypothetical protein